MFDPDQFTLATNPLNWWSEFRKCLTRTRWCVGRPAQAHADKAHCSNTAIDQGTHFMGMFQANGFRWRGDSHPTPMLADGSAGSPPENGPDLSAEKPVWIIYASETGVAEDLAHDAVRRLKKMDRLTRLVPLDTVDMQSLAKVDQALFLASTSGDGEPPFMADAFDRQYMRCPASLPTLHYGLLALGDQRYDAFCAFGRQLHQWLRSSGARALFEPVEMDDEDASALRDWHANMRVLATRVSIQAGTGF